MLMLLNFRPEDLTPVHDQNNDDIPEEWEAKELIEQEHYSYEKRRIAREYVSAKDKKIRGIFANVFSYGNYIASAAYALTMNPEIFPMTFRGVVSAIFFSNLNVLACSTGAIIGGTITKQILRAIGVNRSASKPSDFILEAKTNSGIMFAGIYGGLAISTYLLAPMTYKLAKEKIAPTVQHIFSYNMPEREQQNHLVKSTEVRIGSNEFIALSNSVRQKNTLTM